VVELQVLVQFGSEQQLKQLLVAALGLRMVSVPWPVLPLLLELALGLELLLPSLVLVP